MVTDRALLEAFSLSEISESSLLASYNFVTIIQMSLASHQSSKPSLFGPDISSQPGQSNQEICHHHYHKSLHLPSSLLSFSKILPSATAVPEYRGFSKLPGSTGSLLLFSFLSEWPQPPVVFQLNHSQVIQPCRAKCCVPVHQIRVLILLFLGGKNLGEPFVDPLYKRPLFPAGIL